MIEDPGFDVVGVRVYDAEKEGRDAGELVLEEWIRGAPNVAPEWPRSQHGLGLRLSITGRPNVECDIGMSGDGHGMKPNEFLFVSAARRLARAIPGACAAAPGLDGFATIGQGLVARPRWGSQRVEAGRR
jgi:hypothetical protein